MFHAGLECSWYPWGFDSCKYVEVWRLFVEIVRARTCRTAFMWAPAEAGGYPFTGLIALPPSPPSPLPARPPFPPLSCGRLPRLLAASSQVSAQPLRSC